MDTRRLCDFTNRSGLRVRLAASGTAPLCYLKVGKVVEDRDQEGADA